MAYLEVIEPGRISLRAPGVVVQPPVLQAHILQSSLQTLPILVLHFLTLISHHSETGKSIQRWKSQRIKIHRLAYRFSIDF